jgi:hypothetical protein
MTMDPASDTDALRERVTETNRDPEVARRARAVDFAFLVSADEQSWLFKVGSSGLDQVTPGVTTTPDGGFSLSASKDAWAKFAQPLPPPQVHDVAAMMEFGHLHLHGNALPWIASGMLVRRILDLWRRALFVDS